MAVLSLQTQRGLNLGDLLGPVSDVICGTFITYLSFNLHHTCLPFPEHTKLTQFFGPQS